jgi:hypothetical protein
MLKALAIAGAVFAAIAGLLTLRLPSPGVADAAVNPCVNARPVPAELRLPRVVPPGEPVALERRMLAYLQSYGYRNLGWCHDKSVRDTGPFIDRISYGPHRAVRIFYSPEVMAWLRGGRVGVPADGAVIIKEQYGGTAAAAFDGKPEGELHPADWTMMIRRTKASHDGWFWAELYRGMARNETATTWPSAGFGLDCLRCHSSAAKAMTFASEENVAGYPGEPLAYRADDSWRAPMPGTAKIVAPNGEAALAPAIHARAPLAVQTFPAEPLDNAVAPYGHPPLFVTSSQCMSCHAGLPGPVFGPTMWVTPAPTSTAPGLNVSEFGEWRWSPMGLAGRDPVFYAQLESELAYAGTTHDAQRRAALGQTIVDTCMKCHGAMGKRAFASDHPKQKFSPAFVFDTNPAHEGFKYGGLARDGISCMVCHRSAAPTPAPGRDALASFLDNQITGNFVTGPRDKLFGQFKDNEVVTHPMNEALGAKPAFSSYVSSSQLCGSCHTIALPVVDAHLAAGKPQPQSVEQATYLEWLNSAYQTEYKPGSSAKSCQGCHMPAGIKDASRGVDIAHIASRIALVQDATYPQTTNAAPRDDINVRYREQGYRRHELLGLNAFLLTTFQQFPDVLGVRTDDYMSGSKTDLRDSIGRIVQQARESTATVNIRSHVEGSQLIADVEVVNLTGHRFPSGVGFRRAVLDVELRDPSAPASAAPLFASGRMDAAGRIIGSDGLPLPSESFARGPDGKQRYQEHYDEAHPITNGDEAEVFEELTRDHDGNFTTSFIRRDHDVKDNRLLPRGWRAAGPPHPVPAFFLQATFPHGRAASDPRYRDGLGHAIVRYAIALPPGIDPKTLALSATLNYQAWAPYFLAQRRAVAGPASHRLAELIDHLDVSGGALAGWKLRLQRADAAISSPAGKVAGITP